MHRKITLNVDVEADSCPTAARALHEAADCVAKGDLDLYLSGPDYSLVLEGAVDAKAKAAGYQKHVRSRVAALEWAEAPQDLVRLWQAQADRRNLRERRRWHQ